MTVRRDARRDEPLTEREVQVLAGAGRGLSNLQIAAELFLAEDTVKTHMRRASQKLGATGRAHAVVRALEEGFLALRIPRTGPRSTRVEFGPQAAVQRVTRLLADWRCVPPPPPHLAGHRWQQCITQLAHALHQDKDLAA